MTKMAPAASITLVCPYRAAHGALAVTRVHVAPAATWPNGRRRALLIARASVRPSRAPWRAHDRTPTRAHARTRARALTHAHLHTYVHLHTHAHTRTRTRTHQNARTRARARRDARAVLHRGPKRVRVASRVVCVCVCVCAPLSTIRTQREPEEDPKSTTDCPQSPR